MSLRSRLAALEKMAAGFKLMDTCHACGRIKGIGRMYVFDPAGDGLGECLRCGKPVDQEGRAVGHLHAGQYRVKVYGFPDPSDSDY